MNLTDLTDHLIAADRAKTTWQDANTALVQAQAAFIAACDAITITTAGRADVTDRLTAASAVYRRAMEAERAAWDAYGEAVDAIRPAVTA